ncbi:hypothetical protein THAOC_07525, partial [Thalassiosira oceanica]
APWTGLVISDARVSRVGAGPRPSESVRGGRKYGSLSEGALASLPEACFVDAQMWGTPCSAIGSYLTDYSAEGGTSTRRALSGVSHELTGAHAGRGMRGIPIVRGGRRAGTVPRRVTWSRCTRRGWRAQRLFWPG